MRVDRVFEFWLFALNGKKSIKMQKQDTQKDYQSNVPYMNFVMNALSTLPTQNKAFPALSQAKRKTQTKAIERL